MTLEEFNFLLPKQAKKELLKCCGSKTWALDMMIYFPFKSKKQMLKKADKAWKQCIEEDWREAFTHHPKIGDMESLAKKFANTKKWAGNEQSGVQSASHETLVALAKGNEAYEQKFGYIFIVCATGKSASEMLQMLQTRYLNTPEQEILIAKEEQNKITQIRINKLINS